MHMGVDQAGKHKAVFQINHLRGLRGGPQLRRRQKTGRHPLHLAIPDQQAAARLRGLARHGQQGPRVDDNGVWSALRRGRA